MEDLVNFEKLRMIAKEVRRICGMAPVCCVSMPPEMWVLCFQMLIRVSVESPWIFSSYHVYLLHTFIKPAKCKHAKISRFSNTVTLLITLAIASSVFFWVPGASSESCCQSSLQCTSLSRHAARCSQLVFGQLCSMAVRPGPQTPPIYNGFAEMTVPWSDGSAVQSWKMRFPRLCFTRNWM